jgi:NADH-quinone oxidoreductase subunit M
MLTLLLLIIPLIFSMLVLIAQKNISKIISIASGVTTLILSIYAVFLYTQNNTSTLLKWHTEWLPSIGADFFLQINGINSILILLTAIIFPFIILSTSREKKYFTDKRFYILALIMQSALFGVFLSNNLFVFYIFWELALIPIYFILLLFGDEGRQKITFKFFVYTLFGSLLMLLAIIYISTNGNINNLNLNNVLKVASTFNVQQQIFIFIAFYIAFAIKIPIFPLHTWQADTYVNAPTQGTMLLSGIMLKMGTFALIYWLIPIAPLAWNKLSIYFIAIAVFSSIYAALMALIQKEFKRMLAYASMSHVGLIAAGILTFNLQGLQGSLIQMFAHAINVVAIFYVQDIIQRRTNTDTIKKLGGIRIQNNLFSVLFLIVLFANIALPLTNAFIGEFLLLDSIFQYNYLLSGIAGLTIILGATYMLRTYHAIMNGETKEATSNFAPIRNTEKMVLISLSILIIIFGFFPNLLLNISEHDLIQLIEHVQSIIKYK